ARDSTESRPRGRLPEFLGANGAIQHSRWPIFNGLETFSGRTRVTSVSSLKNAVSHCSGDGLPYAFVSRFSPFGLDQPTGIGRGRSTPVTVRLTHWRGPLRRAVFIALVAALSPLPLAAASDQA